jgi:hypothetical protein
MYFPCQGIHCTVHHTLFRGDKAKIGPRLFCINVYRSYTIRYTLTFTGPCIVIYSYNESQQDALFLNVILVKNSTCFGQTYCSSSGVLILYSQQLVFVILVMLTVC